MVNFLMKSPEIFEFSSNYKGVKCKVYSIEKEKIVLNLYDTLVYIQWDNLNYTFSWLIYRGKPMPINSLTFLEDFSYYLLELYPKLNRYKKKWR